MKYVQHVNAFSIFEPWVSQYRPSAYGVTQPEKMRQEFSREGGRSALYICAWCGWCGSEIKGGFVTTDNVSSCEDCFYVTICHCLSKFSQAGRVMKLGKGMTRLSWNGPRARVVRTFRFGKNGMNGWVNVWGMAGCSLAHKKASKPQQKSLKPFILGMRICLHFFTHVIA